MQKYVEPRSSTKGFDDGSGDHCHHMAAINITEQAAAAAAAPGFEVYNCHENHLLHLNLGAGVNRDAA